MELSGKTAFITGAARGIGQASACAFARAGANVVITDLERGALAETERMVRDLGGKVASIAVDVTDSAAVKAGISAAVDRFGGLDCALNNAGCYPPQTELTDIDEATARRVIEINYWGVFHCMRAQLPVMLRQGSGTIVNISSGAGLSGFPLSAVYCASKHAVIGLTKAAAIDCAKLGVRINCVCPGVIETRMVDSLLASEEGRTAITALHPIGRLGQPSEVGDVVVWLSSQRSSFVVGGCISVDGGYAAT